MDAETYLRRQAESALRTPGGEWEKTRRFELVARALTMSGALDDATADAIEVDLRLAVYVRQPREKPHLSAAFRQFGSRMGRLSARAVRTGRLTASASTSLLSASPTAVIGMTPTRQASTAALPHPGYGAGPRDPA